MAAVKVYHWTLKANIGSILKSGLRQWSFVCREEGDWHGEVCLVIGLPYNIDWDNRDEDVKWQAIVPEVVEPSRIWVMQCSCREEKTMHMGPF